MTTRRGGLGRGLGALIPGAGASAGASLAPSRPEMGPLGQRVEVDDSDASTGDVRVIDARTSGEGLDTSRQDVEQSSPMGARFAEIAVGSIRPNAKQPRQIFDDEALAELAHSLKEVGFLQPVVVRQIGDEQEYELVMGERRWRAAQLAGFDMIPAIVRETDDDVMLRDALLENLHREQLNPLEEGAAYAQLLTEFGVTHEQLAQRIGRSRSQVSNTMRLLNLPPSVQRRVAAGVLSAGHARALLALESADAQDRLAQRIVAEGLSVRSVEEIVAVGGRDLDPPRTPRPARRRAPALEDLASRLSDHFETRVRVELGRSRGKITIDFASVDDLDRIIASMAPVVTEHTTAPTAS